MLSQSLPASALATRFKSVPKLSDRIRSRYLDRLRIPPQAQDFSAIDPVSRNLPRNISSATARRGATQKTKPIPIANRRSNQDMFDLDVLEEDEDLGGEANSEGGDEGDDGFFQFDDFGDGVDGGNGGVEGGLKKTSRPQSIPSRPATNGSSTHRAHLHRKATHNGVLASGGFHAARHHVTSSFVPPHMLTRRGCFSLGGPQHFKRKPPSHSPG